MLGQSPSRKAAEMQRRSLLIVFSLLTAALLLTGCKDDNPTAPITNPVSDFTVVDANPNSDTFEQSVSPRDYLKKVSAWYFGHTT